MSAALLIATHLNAPYGKVVAVTDVERSLMAGHFEAHTVEAYGILAWMFVECEKSLIERAARELGAPSQRLQELYQDSLRLMMHRMPDWE
jgi:hypothetical protein